MRPEQTPPAARTRQGGVIHHLTRTPRQHITRAITAALATALVIAPSATASSAPRAHVFSPDQQPFGMTYAQYQALAWQQVIALPAPINPEIPQNPDDCSLGTPKVRLLVGAFADVERSCTIPAGNAVVFSPIAIECSTLEAPPFHGDNTAQLLACAHGFADTVTSVRATVDGLPVENIDAYRVVSRPFSIAPPDNNILGVSTGNGLGASEGWWIVSKPLNPGNHTSAGKSPAWTPMMAIPSKRHEQNAVNYLNLDEAKALIAAPDRSTWLGRRDHALILLAVLTGVRVTELITLRVGDLGLAAGAHIKVTGKGRKRRAVTLTPETVAVLRQWHKERRGNPEDPLFPSRRGTQLSRDAVELLVTKHATAAARGRPSLAGKRVTPHTLRHYVDRWVMWTPGLVRLLGLARAPVPAT